MKGTPTTPSSLWPITLPIIRTDATGIIIPGNHERTTGGIILPKGVGLTLPTADEVHRFGGGRPTQTSLLAL